MFVYLSKIFGIDQLKYRVHSAVYTKEANHAGEDVGKYQFFHCYLM